MLPAVAQGVIGIEIRNDDVETEELLKPINDKNTETCILAERAFLRTLEGGCQVPIGGRADLNGDEINLQGFVGNMDGSATMRDSIMGNRNDAVELGRELAERMIKNGANDLLSATRKDAEKSHKKVV
jgi:hydroxymethylbilane synthase